MRLRRSIVFLWLCCITAASLPAQSREQQHEPLTPSQIEEIREAGISPDVRIGLYTKYVGEHIDTIKGLTKRARSGARVRRLDDELQNLASLTDELGSNLDQYSERKADIRKSLKKLNQEAGNWLDVLRALPPEPGFELSRKEAIESGQDLAEQTSQLLREQTDYFKLHKDQRGQDRAEPNMP